MDDLYDFLADPSDGARGRRLADALRRKRGSADLLQATGDQQLGGLAAQQYRDADEGQQAVRQAVSGRLTRASALEREQAQLAERERVAKAGLPLQQEKLGLRSRALDVEEKNIESRTKRPLGRALVAGKGAAAPALGPDGKPMPAPRTLGERRLDLRLGSQGVVPGWEVDPSLPDTGPIFSDASHREKFIDKNTSLDQMGGHARTAKAALKDYLDTSIADPLVKEQAAARVNQALNMFAAASRIAEGYGATDQANSTAESLIGLQHGTAFNLRNVANPERIPALLEQALSSSRENVNSAGHNHRLRRASTAAPAQADSRPVVRNAKGERHYLNADGTIGEKVGG